MPLQARRQASTRVILSFIIIITLVTISWPISHLVDGAHAEAAAQNQRDQQAGSKQVDDILKDTMLLLDALDQRLANVQNKTPNALMRDNLRLLETPSDESSPTGSQADGWLHSASEQIELQMAATGAAAASTSSNANEQSDLDSSSSSSPPPPPPTTTNEAPGANSLKQARQLMDANQLASDSTERHIKFTLDLMRAVFASHSSSPQASAAPSTSSSSSSSSASASASAKAQQQPSINSFLISPLSIQMVLMMMHFGARGQTRHELASSLHLAPAAATPDKPPISLQQADLAEWNSNKLRRRNHHQQQQPAEKPSRQRAPLQPPPPQQQQANGAHEMFGSAVRNLLKDAGVLKALTSANQVFLQRNLPLAQQFEWAIKHYYATEVKLVDFQHQSNSSSSDNAPPIGNSSSSSNSNEGNTQQQAHQLINDWIERQSRGKIANFLAAPVPASTLLMAINVIYFKGDWQYKFDPADTEPDAWFTRADGRQVKLPMMVNRLPLAFAHDAAMRTSVVELPYKAQRLGLFLLLPDETAGIFHTMQQLNSTSFAHLISSMRKPSSPAAGAAADQSTAAAAALNNGINIRMPKFSIESSPRLSQVLSQQLGLKSLFAPDVADLTGMFAAPPGGWRQRASTASNRTDAEQAQAPPQVGLDELLHKALLQVDEQGSVAAATSATIVERVGAFNGNYFEADHPFLLFLMDKQTGLVLFSGVFAGDNNPDSAGGHPSSSGCKRAGSYSNSQQQQQQLKCT